MSGVFKGWVTRKLEVKAKNHEFCDEQLDIYDKSNLFCLSPSLPFSFRPTLFCNSSAEDQEHSWPTLFLHRWRAGVWEVSSLHRDAELSALCPIGPATKCSECVITITSTCHLSILMQPCTFVWLHIQNNNLSFGCRTHKLPISSYACDVYKANKSACL